MFFILNSRICSPYLFSLHFILPVDIIWVNNLKMDKSKFG